MTDPVVESAPVTPESVELAVPEVSEVIEEVQQPSVPQGGLTEDRLNELLDERLGSLTEQLERQAQSAKDRGISANAKQINDILSRLDELGGNRDALIQEVDQSALLQQVANLEAQISQRPPVPAGQADVASAWQEEWAGDSQKILDVAAESGVELTPEEYNAAMFNNGVPFPSKGDAFAALNRAIIAKTKGESIPVAAVVTEGGKVPAPPAPPAGPKTFRQKLDEVQGDEQAERAVLDEQWATIDEIRLKEDLKARLDEAGVSPEDLIE